MAINLHCPNCKSSSSLKSRHCKKCGHDLSKGKRYRVVVKTHNGKRVSKIMDSIAMAKKFESKLKTKVMEKTLLGVSEIPTVDEIWEHYLDWAKRFKKSWNKDLQRWQMHVQPHLVGKKMDAITGFDVQRVINAMKAKKKYAPATIKHVLVLIKRVYNWAEDMDLYEGANPSSKIQLPKLNNEVTECLTKDEIKRLLNTLDHWVNQRAALLVKFALYTGFRRGEIFALRWENVLFEKGLIHLRDTKGGQDNYLPASDDAMKVLAKATELMPYLNCQLVFPNKYGNQRTTIAKTWLRMKKVAKIPPSFRFHGLRHTYASYLASSGKVSQYTLQVLLTHKTPQMTQRYAHLFDQTLRQGANLLTSLF